ncbi:response regulator [Hymenobacter sp. 5516J-16]|uniref:LytR/AlgR family response regulator transcription factor n=1 Tax=Hymenobacter sp. 5516J-16 TaxID=2932253 RepID=UPI001FD1BB59|nr:response regulator [Hymenobacter sp. 5516J-16]UOQ78570.1 response regulator [Hymenobacter sp. 5516J-16]
MDVVFLDIHMPRLTGVQLAQLLPQPGPRIVFTTAYDQYAVRSYELNAVDYLLKPIAFERFVQAVQKVRQHLAAPAPAPAAARPPPARRLTPWRQMPCSSRTSTACSAWLSMIFSTSRA